MIFADIRGKLGSDNQRAHDRSEDLLTSTAFGLLRYLPFDRGLGALLARAQVAKLDGTTVGHQIDPAWLHLAGGLSRPIEFWPRLRRGGEPDLRVMLNEDADIVLIEVKLHSGKSPIAAAEVGDELAAPADADEPQERIDPDQLVRYWKGQKDEAPPHARISIIYLTAHSVPPIDDLSASLSREPSIRLGWLSWRDVWAVADEASRVTSAPNAAADLAELLRHKGFFEFNGFRDVGSILDPPGTGLFWQEPSTSSVPTSFFDSTSAVQVFGWAATRGTFFQTSGARQ